MLQEFSGLSIIEHNYEQQLELSIMKALDNGESLLPAKLNKERNGYLCLTTDEPYVTIEDASTKSLEEIVRTIRNDVRIFNRLFITVCPNFEQFLAVPALQITVDETDTLRVERADIVGFHALEYAERFPELKISTILELGTGNIIELTV